MAPVPVPARPADSGEAYQFGVESAEAEVLEVLGCEWIVAAVGSCKSSS